MTSEATADNCPVARVEAGGAVLEILASGQVRISAADIDVERFSAPSLTTEALDRMLEESAVFQRRNAELEAAVSDAVDDARDAVMRSEMAASRAECAATDASTASSR